MTTQILTRFALTAATTLAATAVLTVSEAAHAASVTKNGNFYDYNGTSYTLSTVTGTYNDYKSTLTNTPWWGNQGLASNFAATVRTDLGLPFNGTNLGPNGFGGPLFAYEIQIPPFGNNVTIQGRVFNTIQNMVVNNGGSFTDVKAFVTATAVPTSAPTAVPTPALLPGLLGMGIAAYRKRKLASSTTV